MSEQNISQDAFHDFPPCNEISLFIIDILNKEMEKSSTISLKNTWRFHVSCRDNMMVKSCVELDFRGYYDLSNPLTRIALKSADWEYILKESRRILNNLIKYREIVNQ